MKRNEGFTSIRWAIMREATFASGRPALELWNAVHSNYPSVSFDRFLLEFDSLVRSQELRGTVRDMPEFVSYLRSWTLGVRFWALLLMTCTALGLILFVQPTNPLEFTRWISGTFLVLFVPGFAISWVLFPNRTHPADLDRFALSIAMSLFVVPVIALFMNFSPIGINWNILASIIFAVTIPLLLAGAYREYASLRA